VTLAYERVMREGLIVYIINVRDDLGFFNVFQLVNSRLKVELDVRY